MMLDDGTETIAAISTPVGSGGISIIRMSGEKAIAILHRVFKPVSGKENLHPRHVHFGIIYDKNIEIDKVLVTIFRQPKSYTGEDITEISCHGGMYVSRRILDLLLHHGARPAEPGEFTKRAFLNGRIDLSQAEAVADLIQSKTEAGLQASLQHLEGTLLRKINNFRDELISLCSSLELELDFSEEDIEFVKRDELGVRLESIILEIDKLISTYERGKIIREGIKLVIVGKPNVGKSSLLNALLKEDRAIVTEIPGTTRDPLEEQLDIQGILFRAVDTAGIVETTDIVEKEGIARAHRHSDSADLIIHVVDGSVAFEQADKVIMDRLLKRSIDGRVNLISVVNKMDLENKLELNALLYKKEGIPVVRVSAKEMTGISELEKALVEVVFGEKNIDANNTEALVITHSRHKIALERAKADIVKGLASHYDSMSPEFIALELRSALGNLGEIIGTVTSEDILNHIFENFCIGK